MPRITPRDEDEEFRRRLEFYGDNVPFELVLENMKAEIQALKGHAGDVESRTRQRLRL